jgi:hypothetical protein
MLLDEYIFKNKTKLSKLAKEVGCNYTYLCSIKAGKFLPHMSLALKIEEKTQGQVKWDELMLFCYNQMKKKRENL